MSAGGRGCRASPTGGVLSYAVGHEVRQTAQMRHTSTPFGRFTNSHSVGSSSIPSARLDTSLCCYCSIFVVTFHNAFDNTLYPVLSKETNTLPQPPGTFVII
jgi:hypothetical protein